MTGLASLTLQNSCHDLLIFYTAAAVEPDYKTELTALPSLTLKLFSAHNVFQPCLQPCLVARLDLSLLQCISFSPAYSLALKLG